jgi:GntR family transcriptional regulator/MocR family aminotransferase
MSLARRLAPPRWAEARDASIVEADYESEFRYERRPVEAIQGFDRGGRVVDIGTLSRALFPALRIGYVVLLPAIVRPFRAAEWVTDRQTPTFFQEVVAAPASRCSIRWRRST